MNIRLRHTIALALLVCLPGLAVASMHCAEKDHLGNRSEATIVTDKRGGIESFHWSMQTPAGGSCAFDSSDFALAPRGDATEFRAASGCRLFVWAQGTGITLAHNSCEAQCTGPEAHDYLWPIVFNRRGGGCGRPR